MAWLEIIEIRTLGSNRKLLKSQLQDLIDEISIEEDIQTVNIYSNVMLETDFSIHLVHDSEKTDTFCSTICTQLVQSLKDFGYVNHTIWMLTSKGGIKSESK